MCRAATPISRRNPRSTSRSTGCAIRRPDPCSSAATSSSSPRFRASTASARPSNPTRTMTLVYKQGGRADRTQDATRSDGAAISPQRYQHFVRGTIRSRGDTVEIVAGASGGPGHGRISLFGDEIDSITEFDPADRPEDRMTSPLIKVYANSHLCDAEAGPCARPSKGYPRRRLKHAARGTPCQRSACCWRPSAWSSAPIFDLEMIEADRLLRRHRELFALPDRPHARRAAADPYSNIWPDNALVFVRRKPRHRAPARRHVPGRLCAARRRWPNIGFRLPSCLSTTARCASRNGTPLRPDSPCMSSATPGKLGAGADQRRLRRAGHPAQPA